MGEHHAICLVRDGSAAYSIHRRIQLKARNGMKTSNCRGTYFSDALLSKVRTGWQCIVLNAFVKRWSVIKTEYGRELVPNLKTCSSFSTAKYISNNKLNYQIILCGQIFSLISGERNWSEFQDKGFCNIGRRRQSIEVFSLIDYRIVYFFEPRIKNSSLRHGIR